MRASDRSIRNPPHRYLPMIRPGTDNSRILDFVLPLCEDTYACDYFALFTVLLEAVARISIPLELMAFVVQHLGPIARHKLQRLSMSLHGKKYERRLGIHAYIGFLVCMDFELLVLPSCF